MRSAPRRRFHEARQYALLALDGGKEPSALEARRICLIFASSWALELHLHAQLHVLPLIHHAYIIRHIHLLNIYMIYIYIVSISIIFHIVCL